MFRHGLSRLRTRVNVAAGGARARHRRRLGTLEWLEVRALLSGSPTPYTVNATSDTRDRVRRYGRPPLLHHRGQRQPQPRRQSDPVQPDGLHPLVRRGDYPVQHAGIFRTGWAGDDPGHRVDQPSACALTSGGVLISGNSGFTAITVDTGVRASFSGLSITAAGSGIDNSGTLDVTNCTLEDNGGPTVVGGDIQNLGTMTITSSFISGVRFEGTPAEAVSLMKGR